jgi:hypothetical protein
MHALPLSAGVNVLRRERRLGHVGSSFWNDFAIVAITISFTLVAHLIEIALWAVLFVVCGEFPHFGTAFYRMREAFDVFVETSSRATAGADDKTHPSL